jgi:hypothetical protein
MTNKSKLSRFNRRKKPNYKKALLLILVLLAVIYFYSNADTLLESLFGE